MAWCSSLSLLLPPSSFPCSSLLSPVSLQFEINVKVASPGWFFTFDLSFLLQGATDYHIMYQDQLGAPFFNNADPLQMYENSWHLSNVNNPNSAWIPGNFPAVSSHEYPYNNGGLGQYQAIKGSGSNFYNTIYVLNGTTFNVYNGTYVRLKQLQFSYALPARWYSKAGISKIALSLTAYDLFTWSASGLKGFDPEETDANLYGYNYPITMNFNLGVHITF